MSTPVRDRLYQLLPAIYRLRDTDEGEPLRALLAVIERELGLVEEDIAGLYENWFIETCDEWVVPYIGDLLEVRGLHPVSAGTASQRARVAHTISYRRRKGTALMLEQLARDVTGWPARAVEFFQLLATTQYLKHLRPGNLRTPDLRNTAQLELLGTPFEQAAYTAEVRHIATRHGKYNIPNIGLFFWRLQSYPVTRGTARPVTPSPDGRYTFNPLGYDAPLFNEPQTQGEIEHLSEEINLPDQLRRRPLYDELEARRQALAEHQKLQALYFGDAPVLEVFVDGQQTAISSDQIAVCDLTTWARPPTSKTYQLPDGTTRTLPLQVAIDPKLGRIAFPNGVIPQEVEVSYNYGFSGDLGGGPYNRQDSVTAWLGGLKDVTWQIGVSQALAPKPNEIVATLGEAIKAWNALPAGAVGVITVMDSHTYVESTLDPISIPEGSALLLVAADWPEEEVPGSPGQHQRVRGHLVADGPRPHLLGSLAAQGTAAATSEAAGGLAVGGLLIEGALTVQAGNLGTLRIAHSTLVPDKGGLTIQATSTSGQDNGRLSLTLERSICGPLTVSGAGPRFTITESIVSSGAASAESEPAIIAGNTEGSIQASTIFGKTTLRTLEASNDLFTGLVSVERRQVGCVRFSSLPGDSRTPRRFHCQPDLALSAAADAQAATIRAQLIPSFTSIRYGDPAYAQLSQTCAEELRAGADDQGEMGTFHFLQQPQREANLRASLDEYLRFGLEAGIFYMS
jgi:hypothetical protein